MELVEALEESDAQGSGEVVAAFCPVKAAASELLRAAFPGGDLNAEGFEPVLPGCGNGVGLPAGCDEQAAQLELAGDVNAEPAGEMRVAGARVGEAAGGTLLGVSSIAAGLRPGGQDEESLDGVGDFGAGEPVITMAPLMLGLEKAAFHQAGEMAARCLRCDVGDGGELSGRQRGAAHEAEQDGCPSWIAEKTGHDG